MNRLLIRFSAFFLTSSVMPWRMIPQEQNVSPGLWYLKQVLHWTRSSIFRTSCRSRVPFCRACVSESRWVQVSSERFSAFFCEEFLIKSSIIVDLFGDCKTCFIKLEMRNDFASRTFSCRGSSGRLDMRRSILSPGVDSGFVEVGGFLSNKSPFEKVTILLLHRRIPSLLRWWSTKFAS